MEDTKWDVPGHDDLGVLQAVAMSVSSDENHGDHHQRGTATVLDQMTEDRTYGCVPVRCGLLTLDDEAIPSDWHCSVCPSLLVRSPFSEE